MIVVAILRWLCGYMDFWVEGKFPERFLNLANKKGINLWKLKRFNEKIYATAKISDFCELEQISQKTQTTVHIIKKYGLPVIVEKYRHRTGIFVGAIIFFIICEYLSGFIWNIEINVPDTINEYEIRSELAELGLYEGVKSKDIDIHKIERTLTINNPEISWIAINVMGTDASVEISPNLSINVKENNEDKKTVSNLKSTADGVVTKVEVKNGTAMVHVGEGVTKNQLLVSGIIDYSNGSSALVDSNAQIYAKVIHRAETEIPFDLQIAKKEDQYVQKYDIDILNVKIPLTLCQNPDNSYIKSNTENKIQLSENKIPVKISSEKWNKYTIQNKHLTYKEGEKIANNRIMLYEVFLLYSSDKAKFLEKNYEIKQYSDKIVLSAEYTMEENICLKSIIQTR